MTALFWSSALLIVWIYLGYPFFIWLWGTLFSKPVKTRTNRMPFLSILIAAHDEEATIRAVLDNKLNCNYPRERMEIIVVSDGSKDRTEDIVRTFGHDVTLLVQSRAGKTEALNKAAEQARGDILVFCDGNSIYQTESLRNLVRNFDDATVGYVTGRAVVPGANVSDMEAGCKMYGRYENALRKWETQAGSIVGACGGIDAMRKSLWEPIPQDLMADLYLPLRVVERGYRVVYEPGAVLIEFTTSDREAQWRMRLRVIVSSYQVLWQMRRMLNPLRGGLYSIQLLFHKALRYAVAVPQLTAFASNAGLAMTSRFFAALFAMQIAFYGAAGLGYAAESLRRRFPLVAPVYFFCLVNAACLVAFLQFLRGKRYVVWEPRKG